jgi:single-strand DNA-binding protein
MSSINKAILIGNLGKDPEIKTVNDKQMANLAVATSRKFREETKTQWHNVVVWNENTAGYLAQYAKKGDKVYVEGFIETRKWQDRDGNDRYTTEIIVSPYEGKVSILSSRGDGGGEGQGGGDYAKASGGTSRKQQPQQQAHDPDLDDEIPF